MVSIGHLTRTVLALALLCAASTHTGAQQQPPPATPPPAETPPPATAKPTDQQPQKPPDPQQPPIFRSGINYVRVDVIVSDKKGEPIIDLTQNEFEVTEDGKPQTVESFKLIRVTGSPEPGEAPARPIRTLYDQELEAQREDARIFVIFLDDYHVKRGAGMAVKEPLMRFLKNQIGPLDLVALMYPLTPVADVTLSRNHDAVAQAISQFDGRKHDYTPRNSLEEKYIMYPAVVVEQVRNQVSLSALKSLCLHLGSMREGRKHVILVSEGYTNSLPATMNDPIASMPGYGNPNRGRQGVEETDREQTARFFAQVDIYTELKEVYNAANLTNTAIYALDPRGLAVFEYDINQGVGLQQDKAYLDSSLDTIRVLADQTDGRAIVNRNDLASGLKQIVRDSSAYYLLGYNSIAPTDGKFHDIKVRVKRPGVDVRSRKGFWSLTTEITERAKRAPVPEADPVVTEALATLAKPVRGRPVRTWIGTDPGSNGKTRVTFVWEPVPAVPGERRDTVARVSVMAAGVDSGTAFFRGRVPAQNGGSASSEAAPASRQAGAVEASRTVFDATPGKMQIRLSMESPAGDVVDTEIKEIDVPDFTTPQAALGTPILLRARSAVEARTVRADPAAVPSALREFRRTDQLLIRVVSYGPGQTPPKTTARLLSRGGQAMRDLPIEPSSDSLPFNQIDLPLAPLAPGEYLIEIKAEGEGKNTRQMVAFRVTS